MPYQPAMFEKLFDPADAADPSIIYVADRAAVEDAADLIERFGDDAGYQAAARAERSRNLGNAAHFCRWRQIERLIVVMTITAAPGTLQ